MPRTANLLEAFRKLLLNCKAAGPDGFEGLVADALASLTGLTIRLAKSGSQFGRDASSGPAPFAIAMEAKRYDSDLRLEDLSGKAFQAGHFLGAEIDLWVLGTTTEVGDDLVVRVVLGPQQVPLYHSALFKLPNAAGLESLREQLFVEALDDASIESAVLSAESAGIGAWLDSFIDRLADSSYPADQALALTVAGLRRMNPQSERLLQNSWGTGFLGEVHAAATKAYRRAKWTRHWLVAAFDTNGADDFWRFGKLAEGVADWRFTVEFQGRPYEDERSPMGRFGDELYSRLENAAKERLKKRKTTLFGLDAPDADLVRVLSRDRADMVSTGNF